MQGELYWGVNAADSEFVDPTNSSWEVQWLAGGNGDGSLTYPGRPDRIGGTSTVPIASHRLKQIRDGLQDLEYMFLLQDATGSREARPSTSILGSSQGLSQTRMRHSACSTASAGSNWRAPLRLPLPPARRMVKEVR